MLAVRSMVGVVRVVVHPVVLVVIWLRELFALIVGARLVVVRMPLKSVSFQRDVENKKEKRD